MSSRRVCLYHFCRMRRDTLLDFFEDFASSTDLFLIHDDGYRVRQATYAEVAAAARVVCGAPRCGRHPRRRQGRDLVREPDRMGRRALGLSPAARRACSGRLPRVGRSARPHRGHRRSESAPRRRRSRATARDSRRRCGSSARSPSVDATRTPAPGTRGSGPRNPERRPESRVHSGGDHLHLRRHSRSQRASRSPTAICSRTSSRSSARSRSTASTSGRFIRSGF